MAAIPPELVSLARTLAEAGRKITLPESGEELAFTSKVESGFDPVTRADRDCEAELRRLIQAHHPDHGIAGEEFGESEGTGRWSWSLDPIDGTRAYICGIPSWTTLIALLEDGRPVLGVIDVPRLDELYVGYGGTAELSRAGGTRRISVSGCRSLAEARMSTTDPYLFAEDEAPRFKRLRAAARLTRYGLDGFGYALVAVGRLDLVVESGLKPHDYHALIPIVRAAGGMIGNWSGDEDFSEGKVIAAASRALYEEAVEMMR